MRDFLAEIYRRDRVLALTGWLHVALAAAFISAAFFDSRTVLGVSVWLKPIKFAVSIAIYVWTIAWFLEYTSGPAWAKRLISIGTSIALIVEIVCIGGQSLRGRASHFNLETPFDAAVFSVMGTFIALNTLLATFLLVLLFRRAKSIPMPYLWGIRLGIILAILSGGVGGVMVAHAGHAVGRTNDGPEPLVAEYAIVDDHPVVLNKLLADGGPGLPFVNWSTEGGDLRIAHALGLHALQILPFISFVIAKRNLGGPLARQTTLVLVAGVVYAGVNLFTFLQAANGYPLLRL